ncbi:hypothetical protein ABT279_41915 [Amycolatopsis sp. NPDC000673]|uniref:hypothetical protein n=1 Tax=unclassified Amycolatopsis TaxID=2618356 RepID=UPI00333111B0
MARGGARGVRHARTDVGAEAAGRFEKGVYRLFLDNRRHAGPRRAATLDIVDQNIARALSQLG